MSRNSSGTTIGSRFDGNSHTSFVGAPAFTPAAPWALRVKVFVIVIWLADMLLVPPRCWRALPSASMSLQGYCASIDETRANGKPRVPTLIVHGDHDALVPIEFSTRPYLAAARGNGANIAVWEIAHAQHFDAFVPLPQLGGKFRPLLPQANAAMDALIAHLDGGAMPGDEKR